MLIVFVLDMVHIGKSFQETRALHWQEIKSRVRTHEGELLTGKQGREYQQKWSKDYLGTDLGNSQPIDVRTVQEFEANKK